LTDQQSFFGDPTKPELRPWQRSVRLDRSAKALARKDDPDTSKAAVDVLTDHVTIRRRLLRVYASGLRLTAEGAAQLAGFEPGDGAWKRVSDLQNLGLVYDTGDRMVSPMTGRQQRILAITERGRQVTAGWR
jgi:hypothetical protein